MVAVPAGAAVSTTSLPSPRVDNASASSHARYKERVRTAHCVQPSPSRSDRLRRPAGNSILTFERYAGSIAVDGQSGAARLSSFTFAVRSGSLQSVFDNARHLPKEMASDPARRIRSFVSLRRARRGPAGRGGARQPRERRMVRRRPRVARALRGQHGACRGDRPRRRPHPQAALPRRQRRLPSLPERSNVLRHGRRLAAPRLRDHAPRRPRLRRRRAFTTADQRFPPPGGTTTAWMKAGPVTVNSTVEFVLSSEPRQFVNTLPASGATEIVTFSPGS